MRAIKAHFDGEKVVVPDEVHGVPPGDVIVIFENVPDGSSDTWAWMNTEEAAFEKAWDNEEDAVYDSM